MEIIAVMIVFAIIAICAFAHDAKEKREKEEQEIAAEKEKRHKIEREERELNEQNRRYINDFGRAKTIHMCNDAAAIARDYLRETGDYDAILRGSMHADYESRKAHEGSWAIAGGIADGLAGPAAGISVAADVQRRNAEKRDYNHALSGLLAQKYLLEKKQVESSRGAAYADLQRWEARIKDAQERWIYEMPQDKLLEKLNPTVDLSCCHITSTGAVSLNVKVQPQFISVKGRKRCVIDGLIRVLLFKGSESIGEAIVALPYQGAVSTWYSQEEGTCYFDSDMESISSISLTPVPDGCKVEDIRFEFKPIRLWVASCMNC